MDFAPRKAGAPKNQEAKPVVKPVAKPVANPMARPAVAKPVMKQTMKPVAKPVAKPAVRPAAKPEAVPKRTPKLGEVEVLRKVETIQKPSEKPGAKGIKIRPASETFRMPKFINQDKIKKRPLSKNVYKKKVVVPKEEPKGPVTIITKPEKQAHVSLIIAIILTIILGAAAGTVAFLLLPK